MDVKTRVTDGFESIEIMKSIYQPVGTGVLDGPKNCATAGFHYFRGQSRTPVPTGW